MIALRNWRDTASFPKDKGRCPRADNSDDGCRAGVGHEEVQRLAGEYRNTWGSRPKRMVAKRPPPLASTRPQPVLSQRTQCSPRRVMKCTTRPETTFRAARKPSGTAITAAAAVPRNAIARDCPNAPR